MLKTSIWSVVTIIVIALMAVPTFAAPSTASNLGAQYPAGDVFFFQFLGENDEQMRSEDYKNFYPVQARMSAAGFRVQMNWAASINDLKAALRNTRPTIIIWSSHGQPSGISDKLDEEHLLPPDFFKDISPTVYQFVVATCYGSLAIKNYDLSRARHTKFIGWDFPLSTDYMNENLFKKWNFFENYPQGRINGQLVCKPAGHQYNLVSTLSGKVISTFKNQESCFRTWSSTANGLVCANNIVPNRLVIFDILADRRAANSDFTVVEQWCHEVPSRVYKNRACLLDDKTMNFNIYNLSTHSLESNASFNSSADCYKKLWSLK